MSDAATLKQDPLLALCAARKQFDAAFYAENAFGLHVRMGEAQVSAAEVLKRLKPLMSAEQLAEISTFLDARKKALALMSGMFRGYAAQAQELGLEVLNQYATPAGKGWYEFRDRWSGRQVRAKFIGFDSCYRCQDGKIAGSVRVSKDGSGSTEPWSFSIEDGKMVVITEDSY